MDLQIDLGALKNKEKQGIKDKVFGLSNGFDDGAVYSQ